MQVVDRPVEEVWACTRGWSKGQWWQERAMVRGGARRECCFHYERRGEVEVARVNCWCSGSSRREVKWSCRQVQVVDRPVEEVWARKRGWSKGQWWQERAMVRGGARRECCFHC